MCEEWRHRNLGRALRPCFAKHASKELKTPAPQKRKKRKGKPSSSSSSSSSLSWIFDRFPHIIFIIRSLSLSVFFSLSRKESNKQEQETERERCQPQQGRGWWGISRGFSRIHLLVSVEPLKTTTSCSGTLLFLGTLFSFFLSFFLSSFPLFDF